MKMSMEVANSLRLPCMEVAVYTRPSRMNIYTVFNARGSTMGRDFHTWKSRHISDPQGQIPGMKISMEVANSPQLPCIEVAAYIRPLRTNAHAIFGGRGRKFPASPSLIYYIGKTTYK